MQIRLAKERDVQAILDIYAPYILNTPITFEYEVPSIESFMQRYRRIAAEFPWIVCEVDNRVVGYAYAERAFERAAYQWDADVAVYIAPDYHRMGIAKRFYHCIEAIVKEQGYYHLYAAITETNDTSCKFHEAMGYKRIATFPKTGYKLGRWHDVIWYEKELQSLQGEPRAPYTIKDLEQTTLDKILRLSVVE